MSIQIDDCVEWQEHRNHVYRHGDLLGYVIRHRQGKVIKITGSNAYVQVRPDSKSVRVGLDKLTKVESEAAP